MSDITVTELAIKMRVNAALEDERDRLAPFLHACAAIARALGKDAPEKLDELPAAVQELVDDRRRMRSALEAIDRHSPHLGHAQLLAYLALNPDKIKMLADEIGWTVKFKGET